jgi:CBS domain containing-hemolysin-like protein
LLLASSFFAAAEIAVTMASRVRLRTRAERGERGARAAERLMLRPERAIITCLVGNNLVNIALAAYARNAVLGVSSFSEPVADVIATLVCVPLVLVVGEVLPKAFAQTYPNRTLAALAIPLVLVRTLLWPLAQIAFGIAGLVRRVARLEPDALEFLSREELKQFVAHSERHGHVDADERDLIYRIFEFWKIDPQRFVRRLEDLPTLPADAPAARAKELVRSLRLRRLVLTDPSGREVVGVASPTGLLAVADDARAGDAALPPVRASASTGIDRLLAELQRSPSQVAVVRAAPTGVVLLDDLLRALLGQDIRKNPLDGAVRGT